MASFEDEDHDDRLALRAKRVLVVEDETLVAMCVEDDLRSAGAEVIGPVGSVEAALRLIEAEGRTRPFSAAVVDVKLQDDMAFPVLDHLAALGVPTVIVTGYGSWPAYGAHRSAPVLQKPFDAKGLIAAILSITGAV